MRKFFYGEILHQKARESDTPYAAAPDSIEVTEGAIVALGDSLSHPRIFLSRGNSQ